MENIPSANTTTEPNWPELRQERRAIVVVDVVESVRLMQANEADFIDRWRRFVNEVRTQVLPAHGGRLVKSLGDGLLLEFESVPSAVSAGLDLHHRVAGFNVGRAGDARMELRVGAHVAEVVVDELDIYGSGVNLAARIATLARAGDTVVTADLRDQLVHGLDADFEDLGECYLKHIEKPVRAYRVRSVSDSILARSQHPTLPELRPTIAVIPFRGVPGDVVAQMFGDVIADEVIAALSNAAELNVISRMSTAAFRDRELDLPRIAGHLRAGYVLSGRLVVLGSDIRILLELADTETCSVVWADSMEGDARDTFHADRELIWGIVSRVSTAIIQTEVRRAVVQPLATLKSHSLMLGAITLMHRTSRTDFERARQLLEHLVDRESRHPRPHAWLANWHALRVTQSQSPAPLEDTQRALDHARRALDRDPGCALALAIDGVLQINLVKDFGAAEKQLTAALVSNPNEPLAWLFKGVLHGFRAEGAQAEAASDRALALTPLDPMRHYYDALAASAALGARNYSKATRLAQASLHANRTHPSTYRALAIAQVMSGNLEAATTTVAQLRGLTPHYTVSDFKALSGFGGGPLRDEFADALRAAGLPA